MAELNKEIPPIWTTGWTDILNTGTWRSAMPVHKKRLAPCHGACPVDGEIPVWIQLIKAEKYYEAWLALIDKNPFPAVTGRVCHHPCEGSCNRGEYDGSVSINALEQFIGDYALKEGWSLPAPAESRDKKIAVIGGGPAGLACAYHLRCEGYNVTIFDANPELGGALRYGIPQYRLPKDILDAEIQRLIATGIEVENERFIDSQELEKFEKEYEAVFLAFGAQRAKTLPQFLEENSRVVDALQFLYKVNQGDRPDLGEQVVVIGGGSVAMDVAGTARRLGSMVKVVALEDRESLPARKDDVEEVLEEGTVIFDGVLVQSVSFEDKINLDCIKITLDQNAPEGVLKPIIIPGTEFGIKADNVIVAVGQDTDLKGWEEKVAIVQSRIDVDEVLATNRQGVFAGGDAANSDGYVSSAIGQGRKAALSILKYLGLDIENASDSEETVSYEEINKFYFPLSPKGYKGSTEAEERIGDFREIRIGFTTEQSRIQAERCFSCGHCIECDNCYYFCPDMAISKDSSLEEHYRVLEQYCKGCGCCVEECPRGAVVLKEETR